MNKLIRYLPVFWQLCRFGIVGVAGSLVHFCTVVFLVQIWLLPPLVANVLAFLVSFQVSYWGHRLWTFHDTDALHRVALPRLLFIQILNFAANETLFFIFLRLHLPYQIALLIVLSILPIFTFVSSKLWVFRST